MTRIENEWRYFDEFNGIAYPWYTKPCLEFLENIDLKGKMIFEFGSGYSTLWFRSKGATVHGVDNNEQWAELSGTRYCAEKHFYLDCINWSIPKFDIVCIDGDWRDECTEYAIKKLKPGGMIIIDNYKQPSVLETWPLTEKLIEGKDIKIFKEDGHDDWQTVIVYP